MSEARRLDEIIEEVRRVREELGARYGWDVGRLYEAAKRREGGVGRGGRFWSRVGRARWAGGGPGGDSPARNLQITERSIEPVE